MNRLLRPKTPAIIAALAALSLIAAACGSSAATPTLAPGATLAPTAATTPGASAAPTAPTGGQATDVPGNGGPGVDLGDLAGALEGVDSYRMTVTSDGEVSYMATWVRQPVEAQAIEMTSAKIIIISQEAWLDQGSGGYQSVPLAMVSGLTSAFNPILLFGAYGQMGALGGLTDLGTELKNGVNAHHYRIDSSTPNLGVQMPAGASVDIWVADAGHLVSFVSVSGTSSGDLTIDVTNVNDPSNKVDRP